MSSAVDSATAQMANTTLDAANTTAQGPSIGTGGTEPINASTNEAVIQSAAEGRRLYIGNLAYAATEGELRELFKEYLIEGVSIPINPRTTRPVGYAFVDVSTASEAERAINELKGKTVLDRGISIQLARKPDEPKANGGEAGEGKTQRRGSGRKPRARGNRKSKTAAEGTDGGPTNVPGQADTLTGTTKEALTGEEGEKGTIKAGAPRQRRQRGPPEDGIPSKTKVMVANLPYDMREEKLLDIFKDYSPTSAKLALRPIPRFMIKKLQARNEPRKGRGFAFVSLGSEELQQKAIADMNGKEIDGRELTVKVAIDSPGKEDEALQAQADAETGKENGMPSTAEGSANTNATVEAT